MKVNLKMLIFLMFALLVLFGCSKSEKSVETEIYIGKALHIGIIGEVPRIREEKVRFKKIDFNDLQDVDNLSTFDAIFITKEYLKEADKPQYTSIYNNSHIPFLFIGTGSYVPFAYEDINFDDSLDSGLSYAVLYDKDSEHYWEYGLYNDELNEKNIQSTYSEIFRTVEEISKN